MAHGCSPEPREGSAEPHAGSKCIACGLQPFDGSYGVAACEANHGRVLEHRSGMCLDRMDRVAGIRERHVYSMG